MRSDVRQRNLSTKKFSSRIEREISDIIENEGWLVVDVANDAGINRSFLPKIRKGQSMSAANCEAVLNSMGYTLAIVKMEGKEDAS